MPISAVDTISLAFQHTKQQLGQPFRFWQWTRLALVGLLAGEMGSGGCNLPSNFHIPQSTGESRHFLDPSFPSFDPALYAGLIAVLVVAALVLGVIMLYVSSVMRFVLFDSVLAKECRIRRAWSRRQGAGAKYFFWQIGFALAMIAALVILLGIPAAIAFGLGWFKQPNEHVPGLVLGGIGLFLLLVVFGIAAAVVQVFTKDFVVPQMALEGIGPLEGWRRLWPMIQTEKGGYAGYVGMKIVLAIAAAVIIGIASLILGLVVAIPTAVVAIVAMITGKTVGLTWNALTITIAVVAGCILLAGFLYLIALLSVPAIVFFPAYAMYFLAARYRALHLVLYPPPPPPAFTGTPPGEPPPLLPEPIG